MTTLSRISMAAVAALIVGGMGPAKAADLGGNCCADLEERVAELEATTARKGNRKVSLTISGQISQQLMFWDDGIRDDLYISGPTSSNSRWRMTGTAKISPEVTAGFLYEFEAFGTSSSSQNQTNGAGPSNTVGAPNNVGDDAGATSHNLREAMAWVEHARLGRVSIGFGSSAATNTILVDLSGKGMAASNDVRLHSAGMFIGLSDGTYTNRTWGNFFQGSSGDWLNQRKDHIQYRTPTVAGFTLGASWGEDDYWDVALRYAGEFNGIRIAGAVGYAVWSEYNQTVTDGFIIDSGGNIVANSTAGPGGLGCDINCDKKVKQLTGSLSIRHMPTGLFFTGAAGDRDVDNQQFLTASTGVISAPIDFSARFFYLSGGIARNFFGIGDTVLYGEYSEWKGAGQDVSLNIISSDKLEHWGVGIVQHVDAAAMEFWLAYKNYSLDAPGLFAADPEDLHLFTAGTRIRF